MANQKIGIQVEVNSNLKAETQDANKFREALKRAADQAQQIKVGGTAATPAQPKAAATAGSTRASTMSTQPVSAARAVAGAEPVAAQVMEYGRARGSVGGTGASARDFANQAQGLGGLVRLYATYAANVFAVSTAFRALSSAMDTTNMVRGLDQLGAASGVALGGLSKQLVAVTGGAISLREAMSATVKVTAAGLGGENVLRLGQVAAKASQALGVDMSDAINRLSRGITKLEPELLDELGIFTKIEPAVEKYALSIGKSASQLTDFERRQAFANAVLAEGEKKFAAIKIDANPYNKLAASLADLSQKALELFNKVLAPIVNLLSSSPTALITALLGVAGAIIKQVAPAFGQFRDNIRRANVEAAESGKSRVQSAIALQQELNTQILKASELGADRQIARLDKAEVRLRRLQSKLGTETVASKILAEKPDTADITKEDISRIRAAAQADEEAGNLRLAKSQRAVANSIEETQRAEKSLNLQKRENAAELQKELADRRTVMGMNAQLAQSIEKSSFKSQIVSNAAYAGSLIGPTRAIKLMIAELKAADVQLSKFSTGVLIARGALAAFVGGAATFATALMSAFGTITAIIGIGSLLASLFTNTAKESQATSEAFGQLEESTKNLTNTLDLLNKKPFLEQFTTESVVARANALESFGVALQKSNIAAQTELGAMNWLDKSVDFVKMLWGGDVQSKLTKEISFGLAKIFSDLQVSNSEAGIAAKNTIAGILKVDPQQLTDFDSFNKALKDLKNTGQSVPAAITNIGIALDKLTSTNKATANSLLAVDEALKKVAEARQKFLTESQVKDPTTELGVGLIKSAFEIDRALQEPTARLEGIKKLAEELSKIGGVPEDLLLGLSNASVVSSQLQELLVTINTTEAAIESLSKRQKELQEKQDITRGAGLNVNQGRKKQIREELIGINAELDRLKETSSVDIGLKLELQDSLGKLSKDISEAQIVVFETGAKLVSSKLAAEFAKANTNITNAFAGLLSGTETGLKLRAEAEKQMLEAQAAQIQVQLDQIEATTKNSITVKESTLVSKRLLEKAAKSDTEEQNLAREIALLETEIKSLKAAEGITFAKASKEFAEAKRAGKSTDITEGTLDLLRKVEQTKASLAVIASSKFAVELKLQADQFQLQNEQALKNKAQSIEELKGRRAILTANTEINDNLNEAALIERQALDSQIRKEESLYKELEAQSKIAGYELIIREATKRKRQDIVEGTQREIELLSRRQQIDKETLEKNQRAQQIKDDIDLIQLRGRVELDRLNKANELRQRGLQIRNEDLAIEEKIQQVIQSNTQLPAEILALNAQILQSKRAQLELDTKTGDAAADREKELAELQTRRQTVLATLSSEDPRLLTEAELNKLKLLDTESARINSRYQARIDSAEKINAATIYELELNKKLQNEKNRLARVEEDRQLALQARQQELSIEEKSFEFLQKSITLSPQFISDREKLFAIKRAELEFDTRNGQLQLERQQKLNALAIQEQEIRRTQTIAGAVEDVQPVLSTQGQEQLDQLEEARARVVALSDIQINAAKQLLEFNTQLAVKTKELADEQEKYNKRLEQAGRIGESLSVLFTGLSDSLDQVAQNIGKFAETFAQTLNTSDQNAKAVSTWTDKVAKLKEQEQKVTDPDDARVLYAERAKGEAELEKARKKQERDEISGYAKTAGAAKAMFKEKTFAYKALAGLEKTLHLARLAMEAKEIFTKIFGLKTTTTAKIGAETANTATTQAGAAARAPTYIGEIYAKTFGELGPIAGPIVAASLVALVMSYLGGSSSGRSAASLGMTSEQRQETQGTSLRFNPDTGTNEQYRTGVLGAPDEKTESIKNSLEIIRDNSIDGLKYNDKLLKSFEKLSESIVSFARNIYNVRGLVSGSAFGTANISTTSSGIKGFFGSSTTKEIVDSGLAISGTISEIIRGGKETLRLYETIQTTRKSSGFLGLGGSTKISVAENFKELEDVDARVRNQFIKTLNAGLETITELSLNIYNSVDKAQQVFNTYKIKIQASLRGLKGDDLVKELEAIMGSILADISELTFTEIFDSYGQLGEDALQTTARVADTNRKIQQLLKNITGTPIDKLSLDVTEALAASSGGFSNFLDKVNNFTENFLTDAEKLAPTRKEVQDELDRLGLSSIKTRGQFKALVQQLIETKQTGTETFSALINISEGFAKVTESAEKANEALRSAYDQRVSELKGARDEFKNFAASLRSFEQSIKTSALSPLTPVQQYNELRSEFLSTRDLAKSGDARAIGKLQAISERFLQSSQQVYASSDQYISDFQLVSTAVEQTATIAEQQVATANQTLTEIKNVVSGIIEVKESIDALPVILTGLGTALTTALETARQATSTTLPANLPVIAGTVAEQMQEYEFNRESAATRRAAADETKRLADEAKRAADALAALAAASVPDTNWAAAKGAAFDWGGVKRFAQGGLVHSATPFSYRDGFGVMGEAGPEAIMPLRRTPSGNLGVIANTNNGALLQELARLNQQVEALTQTVADGANLNAQATERNTAEISGAISNTANSKQYQARLQNKVQVV